MISEQLTAMLIQLGQLAMTNTATHVVARVKAAKTGKQHDQQINELTELINELVDERNQAVGIARALEQEIVSQRVSADDLTYITDKLIPALEKLMGAGAASGDGFAALEPVKTLLSVEILTVLQLVGFNYRHAIGEPLTDLVRNLISSQVQRPDISAELNVLNARNQLAILEIAKDPEASARLGVITP